MNSAKRIIRHYATLVHWLDGLTSAASCFKTEKATGFEWTDEERKRLHEAGRLLNQARDIVRELYSKRIGDAVVANVHYGTWGRTR